MSLKCSVLKSGFCELTQGFGGSNNHRGLDLVDKGYTIGDVVSYNNGVVLMAVTGYGNGQGEGVNWRYGNFVKIQHDDGSVCLYAHLERASVSVGQRVSKGQVIGRMGNSGNSFGAHLHWEFWARNDYYSNVDPSPYLEPKEIKLPSPVNRDKNKRQFQVDYNDNLRIRKSPSLNGEILGILNAGVYDFSEEKDADGYKWAKVGDNMWVACTSMSRILEIEKEIEESPVISGNDHSNMDDSEVLDENDTNTLEDEKDAVEDEETSEKDYIEEIEEQKEKEKESVLLWILNIIYNFLKKLIKRG